MNKLNLKLMNPQENQIFCTINDEIIKFKKDKSGHAVYEHQTEDQSVEIRVFKYLEVNSPLYFLWQILFFFVSIFGVFNKPLDKHCIVVEYKAKINLKEETNVKIKLNFLPQKKIGAVVESDTEIFEETNRVFVDKEAKKRKKKLLITQAFLWVMLACLIAFLIIK